MSKQHKYYALALGNAFQFQCVSKTEEEFELRISRAYYSWAGTRPKGSGPAMADFLTGKTKVIIHIEKMEG